MSDISDLLKDAANLFAQLAVEYENNNKNIQSQLSHLEVKTAENREALRTAAEAILKNLS
jgi:hypothetical protein